MKHDYSGAAFLRTLSEADQDTLQHQHCLYHLGRAYISLCLMEDSLIMAITICKKVEVATRLGSDAKQWEEFVSKRDALQSSTLGMLVNILSRHNIDEGDIHYLKWIKEK